METILLILAILQTIIGVVTIILTYKIGNRQIKIAEYEQLSNKRVAISTNLSIAYDQLKPGVKPGTMGELQKITEINELLKYHKEYVNICNKITKLDKYQGLKP